jgi:TRAP-type mannitol/chloroaromatic compound transport system permease small subunit
VPFPRAEAKEEAMKSLFAFAGLVDRINQRICLIATWLVLLSCLVSAINASVRYAFSVSSNAWLELQWYMFAGIVMLGVSYTLKLNEHVRVDVLYARFPPRTAAWVDLLGAIFFLMPAAVLIAWMSWPQFAESFTSGEMSSNAGGLIRWPVKLLIPVGAALLALQGLSEIVKRIGYLRGQYDMDTHYEKPLQ